MKRYVIVNSVAASSNFRMINSSLARNVNSLRKTNDGSKVLFSIGGDISEIFMDYQIYTLKEIREELKESEWQPPIPPLIARLFKTKKYREWKSLA